MLHHGKVMIIVIINPLCRDATRLSLYVNEDEGNTAETCGINLEKSCDVSTNFATRLPMDVNEDEGNTAETCEINSGRSCGVSTANCHDFVYIFEQIDYYSITKKLQIPLPAKLNNPVIIYM